MVFCSSALLLCGLMSYSSSQGAGLIKVERDNSLSRSLELTTLVIPWEISYVLCITFVSLSLSHTHTHTFSLFLFCLCFVSVHLWPWLSYFYVFLTLFLSLLNLLSLYPWYVSFLFSLFCLSLLTHSLFFPPIFSLASSSFSFSRTLPLFTHIKLYIPPELHTGNLPVGPVSPTVAQLAGLIDQWSSWIPQKVNYQLAHQSYFGRKAGGLGDCCNH